MKNRHLRLACALLAVLCFAAGCRARVEKAAGAPQEAESRATPATPESRAAVETVDGAVISVAMDEGWDAAFVAKTTAAEVAACREVMASRIGITPDPGVVLRVELLHDSAPLEQVRAESKFGDWTFSDSDDWTVRFGRLAAFKKSERRLILASNVEITDRAYLFSLALLWIQPTVAPVCFLDGVATFNAGLAVNKLRGEPLWNRGRIKDTIFFFWPQSTVTDSDLAGLCEWGASPFASVVELRDPFPRGELGSIVKAPLAFRALGRFLVYFLGTYDVGPEQHVRFANTPRYGSLIRGLIAKRAPNDSKPCADFPAEANGWPGQLQAYFDLVYRKRNLGHTRNGVLLAWDEYVSSTGKRSGRPDDDLLR